MVSGGVGFSNGVIIVDEPKSVYYPGQLIYGNVHFVLTEMVAYSAIKVAYIAKAVVQWRDARNEEIVGVKRSRQICYDAQEEYCHYVQCVSGGIGTSFLPPGVHGISFKFQLPFNVPSSFEAQEGNVKHRIEVYLEYPEAGLKEELLKEIKVVDPINIRSVANIQQPLEIHLESATSSKCFCRSKPICVNILLPSHVFNIGSIIPVTVEVRNGCKIKEIAVKITMKHTFYTELPRSKVEIESDLVEIKKERLLGLKNREYHWNMKLPDAVLPNLMKCGIIDVAFFFKVRIRISGHQAFEDQSKIFIGLLPSSDLSELKSLSVIADGLPKAPIPNQNKQPAFAPNKLNRLTNVFNSPKVPSLHPSIVEFEQLPPNFRTPNRINTIPVPSAPEIEGP